MQSFGLSYVTPNGIVRRMAMTQERLKELLRYDPETGDFFWVLTRCRRLKPGMLAGHKTAHGYVTIRVDGKPQYAHRLAWLYMTGAWPLAEIDHANLMGADNRFVNLRLADRTSNVANRRLRRDSSSGFKGVFRTRSGNRFTAQIRIDGKPVHLGTFDTAEEAFAFRNQEAERLYGEFYRPK